MNHCDLFALKVNQNESESKINGFAQVKKYLIREVDQNLFFYF